MTDYLSPELLNPSLPSKGRRWLAALIDYGLYFACYTLVIIYWGQKTTDIEGVTSYSVDGFPAFFIFSLWWVLLPVLEGLTGQTLGKALFGLKVIKANGRRASVGNCIVRHLFDIVDGFFFGVVGIAVASGNKEKQRVGDLVAKTIVISSKQV